MARGPCAGVPTPLRRLQPHSDRRSAPATPSRSIPNHTRPSAPLEEQATARGIFVTGSCHHANSKTSNIHHSKHNNIADRLWPRLSIWRGG
eukprot:gene25521-biopygen23989